jgi:hypothetical protein
MVTVSADPCDEKSKIHHFDYRIHGNVSASLDTAFTLSEEEKQSGSFTRALTEEGENFKVYFENEYGIWVHPMTSIL